MSDFTLKISDWFGRKSTPSSRDEAANANQFSYEDTLDERHFRLLSFHNDMFGRLRCTLSHHPLDTIEKYTALSYVWGDPNSTKDTACNGKRLEVTKNLHDALGRLRSYLPLEGYKYVWIDAICINQDDLVEKTAQIRIMGEIYSRASLTIMWLGTRMLGNGESDALPALRLIMNIDKIMLECPELAMPGPLACSLAYAFVNGYIHTNRLEPLNAWMHLWNLLGRSWFERVWVIQEFVLSQATIALCGDYFIGPDRILRIAALLEGCSHFGMAMAPFAGNFDVPQPLSFTAHTFGTLIDRYQSNNRLKLHELVHATVLFKSTNPLDRIFALISLSSDVEPSFIDYTLDVRTVHVNVAKNALTAYRKGDESCLDFLSYIHPHALQRPNVQPSLPSWAPDLTHYIPLWSELYQPLASEWKSPSDGWPTPMHISFDDDESLRLQGVFLDNVSSVIEWNPYSTPCGVGVLDIQTYQEVSRDLCRWESKARHLADSLGSYPTGRSISSTYACTLGFMAANLQPDKAQEFEAQYETFRNMLHHIPEVHSRFEALHTQGAVPPDFNSLFSQLRQLSISCQGFAYVFDRFSKGRVFCTTKKGYMGWVPETAKEGDSICAFRWCRFPFTLRKAQKGYKLLGDSFVHGYMDGETIGPLCESSEEIVIS